MIYFWLGVLFVFGLIIGSFLNAWVWRMRHGESVVCGRSMCPYCRHVLSFFDLIPVISFFVMKGKCRYCRKKISLQYPIVEIATGLLFLFVAWIYRDAVFILRGEMAKDLMIVSLLITIFVYDFLYMEIWDRTTTIPAVLLFFLSGAMGWNGWQDLLIGIGIGAGFFLVQYVVSKGKWIGGGDIRLGLFMGVILGFPRVILALFISYIIGAIVSLVLLGLKKKRLASETPFGTYLTLGTFIAMFWGNEVIGWYVGLIGF